ncbi:hypothetical protein GJ744_009677 [Endocarpon pusillum]|uniref:PLD phosphodiesterase domain-containing protein n=1 Tax=Endocarpon pusillum TaxID=364733 RepID=A0A8H7AU78_9EURO|nr:hypothetical protein GJ744_009677 [Endocarpon pusillum]
MAGDPKETIDLTGDDSDVTLSATSEDDDLRRAIAMSLQPTPTSLPRDFSVSTNKGDDSATLEACAESSVAVGGILGMDRKRQEEERLARLKRKRERSVSPPSTKRGLGHGSDLGTASAHHGGLLKAAPTESDRGQAFAIPPSSDTSKLEYPEGTVRKTWAFGFERQNDIKLAEVLQSPQLEAAVLSSFQWDWDWLVTKLDTAKTKLVFIVQAKDEEAKKGYISTFSRMWNVRLCFPSMEGQINCMHSKLMLLFYPTHLRIAVPTANLTPYDWGEPFRDLPGGIMENTVFLIDLPKSDSESGERQDAEVPFLKSMVLFLKAMKLQEDIVNRLKMYDFSKLGNHGFIHSIGGTHYGDAWRGTGACGIGQYLNNLGLRTFDSVEIDFVTSSVGSLDDQFLRSLYLVAQGDSGLAEYTHRNAKSVPLSVSQDLQRRLGRDFPSRWKQNFRFYYPSDDTVRGSRGGPRNGGTICFQPRWWNGPKFPRDLMRDCQSQRESLLMHNKIWFTRYVEPVTMNNGLRTLGWAYVGSANLSESAWGRLVQDRATKTPKLSCRNWECGVILPILESKADQAKALTDRQDSNGLNIFKNVVPIPMKIPGETYQGTKKPWFSPGQ